MVKYNKNKTKNIDTNIEALVKLKLQEKLEELEKKGDILIINNNRIIHGRTAFKDYKDIISDAFGDISKEQIKAYFAGEAVGANIFTRGTGMVLNPNLELLFTGPQLRSFTYSYNFTPREPEEASNIKNIIRFFKQNMAPKTSKGGTFLESPNVFQLKWLTITVNKNQKILFLCLKQQTKNTILQL